MPSKNIGDRAIVIGGSIAGSLAARILSDYFEKVIIIDRDKFPDRPQTRKGVAQSVQPHILLVRGYRILRELFPGIEQKLLAKGALQIDWAREFSMFSESGWFANSVEPSEIISFTCSRPLLEWIIRDFILEIDNIEIDVLNTSI
ncbi:MAG: FAD-dependent oxidoreductase [Prochloraceae cyanobacterium]